jgi:hypothetical protein
MGQQYSKEGFIALDSVGLGVGKKQLGLLIGLQDQFIMERPEVDYIVLASLLF